MPDDCLTVGPKCTLATANVCQRQDISQAINQYSSTECVICCRVESRLAMLLGA